MHNRIHVLVGAIALLGVGVNGYADEPDDSGNVTGDWGGSRQRLADRGVDLAFDYVGEFAYNAGGGTRHASAYADQFHLGAALDFGKLFRWQGASFHVDVINRNGKLLNDRAHLGTYGVTQINEVYGTGNITRLFNFYLEQSLWSGVVDVKLGRMGVSDDFFPFACDFQNLVFCGNLPSYITQGMMDWPLSQIGAAVAFRPSQAWYVKLGGYEVNPHNALTSNGVRIFPRGHRVGTLAMAEAGFTTSVGSGGDALAGTWSIGGWHNTADFPNLLLDENGDPQVLTGLPAMLVHSITGYYATGRQQVTRNATLFGNIVQADPKTDTVSQLLQLGIEYSAPFAARPHDALRLAVGRQRGSGYVATAERIANANGQAPVAVQGYEYLAELNYKLAVHRGISLLPNIQYIHHPGGTRRNSDVTALGLQIGITF